MKWKFNNKSKKNCYHCVHEVKNSHYLLPFTDCMRVVDRYVNPIGVCNIQYEVECCKCGERFYRTITKYYDDEIKDLPKFGECRNGSSKTVI